MNGWTPRPLKSLVNSSTKAKLPPEGIKIWNLNLDQIETHSGRVLEKVYANANELGTSTHLFEPRTVLYSKLRPYLNKVVVADELGIATTELVPLRCNTDEVLPEYLAYFLRSPDFLKFATIVVAGAKMPRMVMTEFWDFKVPLPPLPEQRRIAAILDKADALRAKRREALVQLDSLTQSIFIEMFGDPGTNPKRFPESQLGKIIIGKPNNGIFKKNHEYGEGVPIVWVEELFRGNAIDLTQSRKLQPTQKEIQQYGLVHGDILFCRSSLKLAGIGYNNVYLGENNKALFECHVIRISPDKSRVSPQFLNYLLRMPNQRQKLFKFAKTVTMSTIDQDGLQQISLPLPPIDLQEIFREKLDAIDRIRTRHQITVAELDTLFASLQHRAFRGEL